MKNCSTFNGKIKLYKNVEISREIMMKNAKEQ